jgi:hypothetical protein
MPEPEEEELPRAQFELTPGEMRQVLARQRETIAYLCGVLREAAQSLEIYSVRPLQEIIEDAREATKRAQP